MFFVFLLGGLFVSCLYLCTLYAINKLQNNKQQVDCNKLYDYFIPQRRNEVVEWIHDNSIIKTSYHSYFQEYLKDACKINLCIHSPIANDTITVGVDYKGYKNFLDNSDWLVFFKKGIYAADLSNKSIFELEKDFIYHMLGVTDRTKNALDFSTGFKELINKPIELDIKPLTNKETDKDAAIRTYNKDSQLHSFDDKPSLVFYNGDKFWHKEGKLHRDDNNPAVIFACGNKYWYKEGKEYKPDLCRKETTKDGTINLCRKETTKDGTIYTYNKLTNKLHSFNDEPAIEYANGDKYWLKEGLFHRDNDFPAVECTNGNKRWYREGLLHRDNDLPAIEYADGGKFWFKEGENYIPDLCRKETDEKGTIRTYNKLTNKLHSFNDKPAIIYSDGVKHWYKDGLLHRNNDLPAIECDNGNKVWYKNGEKYIPDLCRKKTGSDGTIRTYNKLTNQVHSFNDEPAIICSNGTKQWYEEGKLHRDNDLPAIVRGNGDKLWCKEGLLHRDNDLPAIVRANDNKVWYKEGNEYIPDLCRKETNKYGTIRTYNKLTNQLHSFNDEPALVHANGTKYWYKEGRYHRDNDKPAIELTDGGKSWYKEGKLHRDNDLPAIEYANGNKVWYKNGIYQYSKNV